MWREFAILAALTVLAPVSGVAREPIRQATVCQIQSHLDEYDGKMVRVRGLLALGHESFDLASGKCLIHLEYQEKQGQLVPESRAKITVRQDGSYTKYLKYINQELPQCMPGVVCIDCYRYKLTATLTGFVEVAHPGEVGFGHLAMYRARLVIRSFAHVVAVDTADRDQGLCPESIPLDRSLVPPSPSPGANPK